MIPAFGLQFGGRLYVYGPRLSTLVSMEEIQILEAFILVYVPYTRGQIECEKAPLKYSIVFMH